MSKLLLDRYIAKTVLFAIGLVTLMLVGLQLFILFVNQLGDLGKVDFGITQASVFVLLQMPYQVYLFFPMASLLGSLIGLGVLANHSELVVMRAAGMSIGQITFAVLRASVVVIVLMTSMGELLVPLMTQYANDYKTAALSGGQTLRTAQGVWARYGSDFISIGEILPDKVLRSIYQFRFDASHHIQFTRQITEARFEDSAWVAYGVTQTNFSSQHTEAVAFKSLRWDIPVKPKILMISTIEPDEMMLYDLYRYLREQKRTQQNVHQYKLAFYQRIVQPFSTVVMMVLAIPFIFGPLRSSTMGSKLLVGATVGFGFHILNRFFGPMSTVFQLSPELAAIGPTVLFALLGVYLMNRVR
jgi:lipopolysaccharide export system permease protein